MSDLATQTEALEPAKATAIVNAIADALDVNRSTVERVRI